MLAKRLLKNASSRTITKIVRNMGGGGHDHHHDDHHHHGPMMPPVARQAPFKERLPEESELIWDDQVAPETCIDFEAPNKSVNHMLTALGIAAGLFYGFYQFIVWTDPPGLNPVATRRYVLPFDNLSRDLGDFDVDEE